MGSPSGRRRRTCASRASSAHTVYLKKEGYRPELVVIEKHDANDGIDFLTPADVVKRLSPGPSSDPELERRLKIEAEGSKGP